MENRISFIKLALAGAVAVCFNHSALATETGVDNVGAGSDGMFVAPLDLASLPSNLFVFDLYYNHYSATKFKSAILGGDIPDFKVNSNSIIPRVDYLSGITLPGGGRLGGYLAVPFTKVTVSFPDFVGGVNKDSRDGLGDIQFAPIILWGFGKNLTVGTGLEVTVPTGKYDATRLANTSNNFYTYKPVFPITWQPNDNVEVSSKISYSFNQKNKDTDYRSGQIFHFDYSLTYKIADNLHLGVNGYYFKQTTDDKQYGEAVTDVMGTPVSNGNRGQAFAIGPAVHFTFLKYASAELRWEKEFDARNRPEGQTVWAKVSLPYLF
ncbi:transporter [Aquirhabdus sp.]|uniref:SphA family protein n=1 Tax=Aquirhabdus sp. TaxID=2824160 RepID=UPI00396C9BF9